VKEIVASHRLRLASASFVRGLNNQDRYATVHETMASSTCHIMCLQETKLEAISMFDASYFGENSLSFAKQPAIGTRGGILLLWDNSDG
jgi:exonuclease III